MSTITPPEIGLTKPVYGIIGHVKAINIARTGEPNEVRYVGYGNRDITKGPTGQACISINTAVADVHNWHEGKPVTYPKHAEMPAGYQPKPGQARLAAMVSAGVSANKRVGDVYKMDADATFVIGDNNTWPQAWEALLAGHQVRRPNWTETLTWVFNGTDREILWIRNGICNDREGDASTASVQGHQLLAADWIVLPKTDYIAPTV